MNVEHIYCDEFLNEEYSTFLSSDTVQSLPNSEMGCLGNSILVQKLDLFLPLCSPESKKEHIYEIRIRGSTQVATVDKTLQGNWSEPVVTSVTCKTEPGIFLVMFALLRTTSFLTAFYDLYFSYHLHILQITSFHIIIHETPRSLRRVHQPCTRAPTLWSIQI